MATKQVVNTSDDILLVGAREAYCRKTSCGPAYLDLRLGAFLTFVPTGSDDAACVTEATTYVTNRDRFFFGVKDSASVLPRDSGSQFIGICPNTNTANGAAIDTNTSGAGQLSQVTGGNQNIPFSSDGTSIIATGAAIAPIGIPQFSTGNVNTFLGLRLLVSNFGLSTQVVTVSYAVASSLQTVVTMAALRSILQSSASFTGSIALNWFASGAALPLPEHFFIANPFYNNRIRLTTYGSVRM